MAYNHQVLPKTTTRHILAASTAAAALVALAGCSSSGTTAAPAPTTASVKPIAVTTAVTIVPGLPDVTQLLSGGVLAQVTELNGIPATASFQAKGSLQVYGACTGGGQITVTVGGLSYKVTCDGKSAGSSLTVTDSAEHSYTLTVGPAGRTFPLSLQFSVAVGPRH